MQMTIEGSYIWTAEKDMIAHRSYTHRSIGFVDPGFTKRMLNQKNNKTWKILRVKKIQVISIDHRPWPQPRFQGKIPRNEVALTSCKETIKPPRWARMGIRKKSLVFLFSLIFIILQPIRIKSIMKLSRVARSVKHAQRAQKKERKKERENRIPRRIVDTLSGESSREEKRSVLQGARMLGNHLL